MLLLGSFLLSWLLSEATSASAATFTVTTTADAGAGSLREVITDLNASAGPHAVDFDIPQAECAGNGVCKIVLASALPPIEEPVVIDGTSQPRYGTAAANVCATPLSPSYMRVEIDGGVLVSSESILSWSSAGAPGDSLVQGLSFTNHGFFTNAVVISISGAHRVQCNHFGVDGAGTARLGSGSGVILSGSSQGVTIGTNGDGVDDLAERNVITLSSWGVYINANSNNVVAGNYFGTLADGVTVPISGCNVGVYMRQASGSNRIGSDLDGESDDLERNIFAGCSNNAIEITSWASFGDFNEVVGNWIGLTAAASAAGNGTGIAILLGGPSLAQDTLVSSNRIENNTTGIRVNSTMTFDPASSNNCIEDNATGMLNGTSVNQVFENMWWGAADGPSGDGPGSGDPLTITGAGSIDIDPVLAGGCTVARPFVVTTTADAGAGSLREAITNLNASAGPHVVVFDIPEVECAGNGVCKIVLASALPLIEEPVVIDGTSQPRYGTAAANVCATPLAASYMRVEIDGAVLANLEAILS